MRSAALLKREIEQALQDRFPAALTPAPRAVREVAATGIAPVDELLDGGLPIGAISELTGPVSSGRTSLAVAFLARRTAEGCVCAWVDVNDEFDPESAAAGGVTLPQLLWVRCQEDRSRSCNKGTALAGPQRKQNQEGALAPAALSSSFTPLAPGCSAASEALLLQNRVSAARSRALVWPRLDQALRSTDLLLQAGGFAAIVLDLGSTAREDASRIPLATWFRFRQAADRTRCSLVVLGRASVAQSSVAVVLECSQPRPSIAGGRVLENLEFAVQRGRMRSASIAIGARKPPVSTWIATPSHEAKRQEAKRCA